MSFKYKIITVLVIVLLFLSNLYCTKTKDEVLTILMEYDYGDYSGRIYISSNEENIKTAFIRDSSDKSFLRAVNNFIVTPEILDCISDYAMAKCNSNFISPVGDRLFTIQLFDETGKARKCYLVNNNEINTCFLELNSRLETRLYKSRSKDLVKAFKSHIR